MSMRAAASGIKKYYLSRSEMILRTLPRFDGIEQFEKTYKQFLSGLTEKRTIERKGIENIAVFPIKSFKRFPKATIDRLIKSSYDVLKTKKLTNSAYIYNNVLMSYRTHGIDCDVSEILKDMNENNIQFNDLTYGLLIEMYSDRGDVDALKSVINVMKTNGIEINDKTKCDIYGGYIRGGLLEEAKQFLTDEKIHENKIEILLQRSKAYSDIKDIEKLHETLEKLKEIDANLPVKISFNLYQRLVKAKASESELEEVLTLIALSKNKDNLHNLIFHLNRDGFYNHSLKLMLKFEDRLVDNNSTTDIIKSFSNEECPINIYMTVLEKFTDRIFPRASLNLFAAMNFDVAFKRVEDILTENNAECLICNLLVKAIKDESINDIDKTLTLASDNLKIRCLNTVIQYTFIPFLIEGNIVSKPEDILQLLPQHKVTILPSLFLHFLCKGDFVSFDSLLKDHHQQRRGLFRYTNFSRTNAKNILDNIPFKEIENFALMASKVFSPQFVNWLIGSVICEKIIQLSTSDNVSGIEEAIKTAKNFGITLGKKDMEYLVSHVPKYPELIKNLEMEGDSEVVTADN